MEDEPGSRQIPLDERPGEPPCKPWQDPGAAGEGRAESETPPQPHAPAPLAGDAEEAPLEGLSEGLKLSLRKRVWREFLKFAVIFAYLWLLLAIFDVFQSIVLAEHGLNYRAQGFAFVNALMLAKVMLLGEEARLGRRFENRALIYPIMYKSLIFSILLMSMHIAERIIMGVIDGKDIAAAIDELQEVHLRIILSSAAVIFVALIPFFAFKELARVIGEGVLLSLLFGRGEKRLLAAQPAGKH